MSTELKLAGSESPTKSAHHSSESQRKTLPFESHSIFVSLLDWHEPNSGMFFQATSWYGANLIVLWTVSCICLGFVISTGLSLINEYEEYSCNINSQRTLLEDLKWPDTEKSCEVFPTVKQWACWLLEAAVGCFAVVQVCREVALSVSTLCWKPTVALKHKSHGDKAVWMLHGFFMVLVPVIILWEVALGKCPAPGKAPTTFF